MSESTLRNLLSNHRDIYPKRFNNEYRIKQKSHGKKVAYRSDDFGGKRTVRTHYFQKEKNRLFIVYGRGQADELKRLCGKMIKCINLTTVEYMRLHSPFNEEIDLKRRD